MKSEEDRTTRLFSSCTLGGLNLPNRVVVPPMCQYSAVDGVAQPWHLVHTGMLANSGAGAVILEATAVEARGRISPSCLGLYDDRQEAALTEVVRQVRTFSTTALGIQIAHAGRKASCRPNWEAHRQMALDEGGWETVGPSAISFGEGWRRPNELDDAGLAEVRAAFAESARRADRCGFDLLEIHAAHGYLLNAFSSPLANFRQDSYGGSVDNRLRFPLEVAKAVRDVWPADKALGVRVNATDWHERGAGLEEACTFAARLKQLGIDYVTASAGNAAPDARIPPVEPGYMVPLARRIRSETGIPTMAVGMILFPEQAEAILASGDADLIGVARGFLDDPRWGWHAANALEAELAYPRPYARATPARWPGYGIVHASDQARTERHTQGQE